MKPIEFQRHLFHRELKKRLSGLLFIVLLFAAFNADADAGAAEQCSAIFGLTDTQAHVRDGIAIPQLHLAPDEVALLGYGSLLNIESMESTLGHAYKGPVIPMHLKNWGRSWDVVLHNEGWYYGASNDGRHVYPKEILYLNATRKPGTSLNGMLFVIKKSDLAQMDAREMIYDQADITSDIEGVAITGGRVIMYVGREEFRVRGTLKFPDVGLRSSYLKMVMDSVNKQPPEFQNEFKSTTDPLPPKAFFEDIPDYTANWN